MHVKFTKKFLKEKFINDFLTRSIRVFKAIELTTTFFTIQVSSTRAFTMSKTSKREINTLLFVFFINQKSVPCPIQ